MSNEESKNKIKEHASNAPRYVEVQMPCATAAALQMILAEAHAVPFAVTADVQPRDGAGLGAPFGRLE